MSGQFLLQLLSENQATEFVIESDNSKGRSAFQQLRRVDSSGSCRWECQASVPPSPPTRGRRKSLRRQDTPPADRWSSSCSSPTQRIPRKRPTTTSTQVVATSA